MKIQERESIKQLEKFKEQLDKYDKEKKPFEVNRYEICPFLMKVFYRENEYNSLQLYEYGNFPMNEIHIYTWMDATLREITNLLQGILKLDKNCVYKYSIVFYDSLGSLQRRKIGDVYLNKNTQIELKNLKDLRFYIGDYLDICII